MNVYITMHDRLTWPKAMVEVLQSRFPQHQPVLVDTESTYPPLLEWYETRPCRVERVKNLGERSAWLSCLVARENQGKRYVVTDPDLDISALPADTFEQLGDRLDRYPKLGKAGLSIRLDDLPVETNEIARRAHAFEQQHWLWGDGRGDFFANIDTTFAMYQVFDPALPRSPDSFFAGLRLSPPYTCRHLPWYLDLKNATEEDRYYLERCVQPSAYWSTRQRTILETGEGS